MSALLDEIIEARKQKAIEYEEYLKQIAELVKKTEAGKDDDTPTQLDTSGKRALYNSLLSKGAIAPITTAEPQGIYATSKETDLVEQAIKIDKTIKHIRPDNWRDNGGPKEQMIKAALYGILQDVDEIERIFLILQQQPEY
jgi:type I restriction enzyme, R subunit